MPTLYAKSSDFNIVGNNDLVVNDGALRLAARDGDNNEIVAYNRPVLGTVLNASGNDAVWAINEYVSGVRLTSGANLRGPAFGPHGGPAFKTEHTTYGGWPLSLDTRVKNLDDWTLDFHFYADSLLDAAGRLACEAFNAGPLALTRWDADVSAGNIRLRTYDNAGASTLQTAVPAPALAINTHYRIRISYSKVNTRGRISVARYSDDAILAGNQAVNHKTIQDVADDLDFPWICMGALMHYIAASGIYATVPMQEGCYGEVILYNTELILLGDIPWTNPGALLDIYALQSDTADVVIDSGADNTEWDTSTADVDDSSQWNVGAVGVGPGWELRYECDNNAAVGAYSAWMTLDDFKLEGLLSGKYLKKETRCNSDGISSFYPFKYFHIDTTIAAGGGLSRARIVNSGGM